MNTYRVMIIDEESQQINRMVRAFQRQASGQNVKFITSPPLETKDEMIQFILESDIDAVISDYLLNEKKTDIQYSIDYTGGTLKDEFDIIKLNFPFFIVSSDDRQASYGTKDVNSVFAKRLHIANNSESTRTPETGNVLPFFQKVLICIDNYKEDLKKYEEEFNILQSQIHSGKDLNAKEEDRLIFLDTILEKSNDSTCSLPAHLKSKRESEQLSKMLHTAELILESLNK